MRVRVRVLLIESSPPESVDGATQRLDGSYDAFVDEKKVSIRAFFSSLNNHFSCSFILAFSSSSL